MSTIAEYFVRHYTLVIDNTEDTYKAATRAGVRVVRESGVSAREWKHMSDSVKRERFADEIGEKVSDLIMGWWEESVSDRNHPGSQLAGEILIFTDSDINHALGWHYMPEDADVLDLLDDDEDEDDE